MMKLIVLGTGTAITYHHHCTFFILDNGSEYFLVDGGGGNEFLLQTTAAGIDYSRMHWGFLSHEHTDHLFGMVYALRQIAYMIDLGLYEGDFTLYCNSITAEKFITVCQMILRPGEKNLIGNRFHVVTVEDGEEQEIIGCRFTFFDVGSRKAKQFGFQLQYDGKKTLTFFGDEPLRREGLKYIHDADWMLAEAFCLYSEKEYYNPYKYHHSTVKEASENAENNKVKNLILWHTEDQTTNGQRKRLYESEARQYFHGNIYVPDDGEIIEIT